jgi:hypothetical protein
MKIHQVTEEEMESIALIMDSCEYGLRKDSPYWQDILNVKNFLNRNTALFNTTQLLQLCWKLVESNNLTDDGFKEIRELVREALYKEHV